jgi:energy-coupling factor transporter ATP-binding protein EcfA2
MGEQFPDENAGGLRNHLAKTGIAGTVQDTRMERLSFSQRSCVIFSKLTYVCPHLLIMDEPTNFLDLESVDSLISACNKYKGALLLVSHNRDFLKKCAKQYLSVVPGHFQLYDNLKQAEQATYSFIAEMEEGGSAKGGFDLSKSGGTVHASQVAGGAKTEEKKEKPKDGILTIGSSSSSASVARPAATAVKYEVGEKCQALWTDGKYYDVQIMKIALGKYTVKYLAYGNSVAVDLKALKKAAPAAAKAAPGAKPQAAAAAKKK